jgi:hypothetical protein
VAPASPAAPQEQQPGQLQEPLVPSDENKAQIPEEILKLPAFRALLEGTPPAVKVSKEDFQSDPTIKMIQGFAEPLLYSGFGFYRPKDGTSSVMYNSRFIDGNALKIADDKGKLDDLAAPYGELKTFFDTELAKPDSEGDAPAAPAPSTAPKPITPAAPSGVQAQLGTARLNNLAPGAPTSGPAPGQGRVLSQILKPTV